MTKSIASLTELDARRLLFTAQLDAANYLRECAERNLRRMLEPAPLTNFDYSGDHDDYDPAASEFLDYLTRAITWESTDALTAIAELIANTEFADCANTCDFTSDLHEYIPNDYDD